MSVIDDINEEPTCSTPSVRSDYCRGAHRDREPQPRRLGLASARLR